MGIWAGVSEPLLSIDDAERAYLMRTKFLIFSAHVREINVGQGHVEIPRSLK